MIQTPALNIAFRVDASLKIGTGHVMRCLTLAEALRERGAACHFISREYTGHLLDIIRQRGFAVSALPQCPQAHTPVEDAGHQPPHAHWLGCDWETDARQTGMLLADIKPDWLVVDHYALDIQWERALQGCYKKLLGIDDLADRPHTCDLLLDQNLGRHASDYAHLVPKHCKVLAGPHYALLRPEFAALREYSLMRRESPALKHLIVTMGGIDQPNATGQVLESLKTCPLPDDCRITVVMGGKAPWLQQVREMVSSMPWPTAVRVNVSDMAQVMADSDLAIGAAGSTSWERCCLGLPTLLVVLAENQRTAAAVLEKKQLVVTLQLGKELNKSLSEHINQMVCSKGIMLAMAKRAAEIIDGRGCERVLAQFNRG